jgi:hypothetical protein
VSQWPNITSTVRARRGTDHAAAARGRARVDRSVPLKTAREARRILTQGPHIHGVGCRPTVDMAGRSVSKQGLEARRRHRREKDGEGSRVSSSGHVWLAPVSPARSVPNGADPRGVGAEANPNASDVIIIYKYLLIKSIIINMNTEIRPHPRHDPDEGAPMRPEPHPGLEPALGRPRDGSFVRMRMPPPGAGTTRIAPEAMPLRVSSWAHRSSARPASSSRRRDRSVRPPGAGPPTPPGVSSGLIAAPPSTRLRAVDRTRRSSNVRSGASYPGSGSMPSKAAASPTSSRSAAGGATRRPGPRSRTP